MVALAILKLVKESPASPPTSRISGLPNLFGVCVQLHVLPLLARTGHPHQQQEEAVLLGDYTLILAFYFLLAFTGIFAFRNIDDLYISTSRDSRYVYKLLETS
jgi:hypothetical protein